MNFRKTVSVIIAASIAILASGCAAGNLNASKQSVSDSYKVVDSSRHKFGENVKKNSFISESTEIWVSAKNVSADKSDRFDNSWLKRDFIWDNGEGESFYNILTGIEKAYPDLLVTYNDDVPNYFLSIDSASASSASGSSDSSTGSYSGDTIFVRYSGTLEGFLNTIAAKKGLSWNIVDNKHIEFTFQETKVFHLDIMSGILNSSGKVSLGSENGSSNSMNADFTLISNIWEEVIQTVGTYLSQSGTMTPSASTGTITVKDTAKNIEKVQAYIDSVNKDVSRQIMIDVKVYKVTKTSSDGYGLDWNAVYNSVRGKFNIAAVTGFGSVMSTNGTNGLTSITAKILMPNSPYKDTSAIVKALSTQGGISIVTETQVVTMNNMPVPVSQTNEISYIESQTAATVDTAGNTIPGAITPGSKTVGFYMVLSPRILKNDKLMMQMSIDLSDMTALITRASSSAPGATVIQTPEIARNSFFQRVIMNSGETLMMTGFSKSKTTYNDAGIGHASNYAFGGSREASKNNEYLVMLVTPVISEMSVR